MSSLVGIAGGGLALFFFFFLAGTSWRLGLSCVITHHQFSCLRRMLRTLHGDYYDMRTAKVQRFRQSVPGTYFSQSSLPIRSLKLTKGPPNLRLLHLDKIWVFCWITGNLSSLSTKELKFPDIQPNSCSVTRTKYPPFMKFKGVQGIWCTITRDELIWGAPSCRGVLFLSVKQHATTRWTMMMRKTNTGFL